MPKNNKNFSSKDAAREYVWNTLQEEKVARFPFPPQDRIPNFAGAKEAAERLINHKLLQGVNAVKVNPDAPQRYIRQFALERNIIVFVPTPRLRAGFKKLDPEQIPSDELKRAASLSHMDDYAETVDLSELPQMDVIIAGSVAVTRRGQRCGKGHGYSDLEYAILRELGHEPAPVATTVHGIQLVEGFPSDAHDIPLTLIVTPEATIEVDNPPEPPSGINWDLLTDEDLEEMPVLRELREM